MAQLLSPTLSGLNPLLEILIKLTIVLILGWSLHGALRRCNPRWRIFLWRGVGCGMVLIPALVPLMPKLTVPVQIKRQDMLSSVSLNSSSRLPTQIPLRILAESTLNEVTSVRAIPSENPVEAPMTGSMPGKINLLRHFIWMAFGIVWAVEALGLFALAGRRSNTYRRMMIDGHPAPESAQRLLKKIAAGLGCKCPPLRVSALIPSPILVGIRQPVILLPDHLLTE